MSNWLYKKAAQTGEISFQLDPAALAMQSAEALINDGLKEQGFTDAHSVMYKGMEGGQPTYTAQIAVPEEKAQAFIDWGGTVSSK